MNLRLLPVLIVVATLALILRVGEILTGFNNHSGAAIAEEQAAAEPSAGDMAAKDETPEAESKATEEKPDDVKKDDMKADDKMAHDKKSDDKKNDDKKAEDVKDWPDPAEMDPDLADARNSLLKDLSARRKQLDDREKQLTTREAVLKAAESEIDQKYRELTELRKQLQGLLSDQSSEENARIGSLVKIYEGMKPAEAARIFNTLDLTILLDVISRMSERKTSPILAAMEPDRARTITLLLAQQKKLPELPELVNPQAGATDSGQNPPSLPQ